MMILNKRLGVGSHCNLQLSTIHLYRVSHLVADLGWVDLDHPAWEVGS